MSSEHYVDKPIRYCRGSEVEALLKQGWFPLMSWDDHFWAEHGGGMMIWLCDCPIPMMETTTSNTQSS